MVFHRRRDVPHHQWRTGRRASARRVTDSGPVLVVLAVRAEVRQLPGFVRRGPVQSTPSAHQLPRVVAERCGIGTANAARATDAALARWRPKAVVVAGIAGGLQPDLVPGTAVVLEALRSAGSRVPASPRLTDAIETALRESGVAARRGEGWSVDGVADAAKKRRLGADGALTVDSESYAVLARASARGVPAAALRVVADPLERGVPRSLAAFAWIDGAAWWPHVLDLWRLPLEIGEVAQFRRDLRDGLAGLRLALPPVLEALMS